MRESGMTASAVDAYRALDDFTSGNDANVLSRDGSSRVVYRFGDTVYKVDILSTDDRFNIEEYEYIVKRRDSLPTGVFFPNTSMFSVNDRSVIAMDYIEGQTVAMCYCTSDEECDAFCIPDDVYESVHGICSDLSGLNVIVNDDGVWIVDPV